MIEEIRLISDQKEIKQLYEFIKRKPLDYPGYLDWLEKCKRELELGCKKAFAYFAKDQIVANIIFQRHKKDPLVLELKNGRVDEGYSGRGVFRKLIDEVENYAKNEGFKRIVGDCHIENVEVIQVLEKLGFRVESAEKLYEKTRVESVLAKEL